MVSAHLKMKMRGVFKKSIEDVKLEAKSAGMTVNEFYNELYDDFYAPIIKLEKQNTVASNRNIKKLLNDVKISNKYFDKQKTISTNNNLLVSNNNHAKKVKEFTENYAAKKIQKLFWKKQYKFNEKKH